MCVGSAIFNAGKMEWHFTLRCGYIVDVYESMSPSQSMCDIMRKMEIDDKQTKKCCPVHANGVSCEKSVGLEQKR